MNDHVDDDLNDNDNIGVDEYDDDRLDFRIERVSSSINHQRIRKSLNAKEDESFDDVKKKINKLEEQQIIYGRCEDGSSMYDSDTSDENDGEIPERVVKNISDTLTNKVEKEKGIEEEVDEEIRLRVGMVQQLYCSFQREQETNVCEDLDYNSIKSMNIYMSSILFQSKLGYLYDKVLDKSQIEANKMTMITVIPIDTDDSNSNEVCDFLRDISLHGPSSKMKLCQIYALRYAPTFLLRAVIDQMENFQRQRNCINSAAVMNKWTDINCTDTGYNVNPTLNKTPFKDLAINSLALNIILDPVFLRYRALTFGPYQAIENQLEEWRALSMISSCGTHVFFHESSSSILRTPALINDKKINLIHTNQIICYYMIIYRMYLRQFSILL